MSSLELAGVRCAGAGCSAAAAARPAALDTRKGARILVFFGFASRCSGVPRHWAAGAGPPGVNLIPSLAVEDADSVAETIHAARKPGDVVVASIHWGRNWGYEVPQAQVRFAHGLIDTGAVDLVHGQPLPPLQLQPHFALDEGGPRSGRRHRKHKDELHSAKDDSGVLAFEGIEEEAVPAVDGDLDEEIGDHQPQHAERQQPCSKRMLARPEPI
jgi:hypothetical protein